MAEVTLESLAKRVEELERIVADMQRRDRKLVIIPGTGDWEAFERAADELSKSETFDWDAVSRQDEVDMMDVGDRLK